MKIHNKNLINIIPVHTAIADGKKMMTMMATVGSTATASDATMPVMWAAVWVVVVSTKIAIAISISFLVVFLTKVVNILNFI